MASLEFKKFRVFEHSMNKLLLKLFNFCITKPHKLLKSPIRFMNFET